MENLAHGSAKAALVGRDRLVRALVAGGSRCQAVTIGRCRHDVLSSAKAAAEPLDRGEQDCVPSVGVWL